MTKAKAATAIGFLQRGRGASWGSDSAGIGMATGCESRCVADAVSIENERSARDFFFSTLSEASGVRVGVAGGTGRAAGPATTVGEKVEATESRAGKTSSSGRGAPFW